MELGQLSTILLRRWWLVVLVPALVLALALWRTRAVPYQVNLRATVLIPGDTEVPGSAERPELMVLDDLPALIQSRVFAEAVAAKLPTGAPSPLTVGDVQAALHGERYSRILTVRVTRSDAVSAEAIAGAVQAVLPDVVNRYLVADGSKAATVKIIDPPGDATRNQAHRRLIVAVQTLVALAAGTGLAIVANALDPRLHSAEDIGQALGLPVLADLRAAREPAYRIRRGWGRG